MRGKGGEEFCMKPMNCPHHADLRLPAAQLSRSAAAIFRSDLGLSRRGGGCATILSRVRMITQDDAHVFCLPEQVQDEALRIYQIIDGFYRPSACG